MVTEARDLHCRKAYFPIKVTDEGIVTETKALQLQKT